MEVAKRFGARAARWEYTFLCLLVVANLAIHFSTIQKPAVIVFDEVHYITNARLILSEHTDNRTEHPPLGSLLIAASITVLGDNPFGWRTLPVLFGTANIALFYLICRRLRMSRRESYIAVFLLTFENLSFVQGSLAMLDVFSLTFMLLSFWLYLRRSYPLSTISVALAALAKLTGVFAIVPILLHWLIARRDDRIQFLASLALAPLSFLLLLPALQFAIYHRPMDFIYRIKAMLAGTASLTFANTSHPSAIRPWEWLIVPKVMPYYYNPHYFGAISFTIWALIIPVFAYMIFKAVKKNVFVIGMRSL